MTFFNCDLCCMEVGAHYLLYFIIKNKMVKNRKTKKNHFNTHTHAFMRTSNVCLARAPTFC